MGVRSYVPAIGRFLTPDPVPGGSANAYDYVNQDPVNNFDPGGTFSKHVRTAWRYFRRRHYSKKVAAAIIGNLMQESGPGLDPRANNGIGNRGIAQWESNRGSELKAFAATRGASPYSLGAQLGFVNHELQGAYAYVRQAAHRAGSVVGATVGLEQEWERCGEPGPTECNQAARVRFANHVYYRFG